MAKNSNAGMYTFLILALVFPLGAANFLLNLVLTVLYLPSLASLVSQNVDTALRIFLPMTMYLVGLAFSIVVLRSKNKDTVLTITALVLNSILIVSGFFFIYSAYFAAA